MPKRGYIVGTSSAEYTKQCLYCGYEVASDTGIKLHLKVNHGVKGVVRNTIKCCFACKKEFRNEGEFEKHMKKEHY